MHIYLLSYLLFASFGMSCRVGGALIPGVGFCWAMNWLSNFGVTLSFPVLAKAEGSPIKTDVLISYLKGFRSTFRFCLEGSMFRGYDCPALKRCIYHKTGIEPFEMVNGWGSFWEPVTVVHFPVYIFDRPQIGALAKATMQHWTNLWQVPFLHSMCSAWIMLKLWDFSSNLSKLFAMLAHCLSPFSWFADSWARIETYYQPRICSFAWKITSHLPPPFSQKWFGQGAFNSGFPETSGVPVLFGTSLHFWPDPEKHQRLPAGTGSHVWPYLSRNEQNLDAKSCSEYQIDMYMHFEQRLEKLIFIGEVILDCFEK